MEVARNDLTVLFDRLFALGDGTFIDRHGDPDLMAGYSPGVVDLNRNLLSWRIDEILGLCDPVAGVGYDDGFILATGVHEELEIR